MPFCERTHKLGLINNESRIFTFAFKIFSNQLVNKSWCSSWISTFNMFFFTKFVKEVSGSISFKLSVFGKFNSYSILKSLHHRDSLKWRSEVNFYDIFFFFWPIWMVLNFKRAMNGIDHLWYHFFSKFH